MLQIFKLHGDNLSKYNQAFGLTINESSTLLLRTLYSIWTRLADHCLAAYVLKPTNWWLDILFRAKQPQIFTIVWQLVWF